MFGGVEEGGRKEGRKEGGGVTEKRERFGAILGRRFGDCTLFGGWGVGYRRWVGWLLRMRDRQVER